METKFINFVTHPAMVWVLTSQPISWVLSLLIPWMRRDDRLPKDKNRVRKIFLISYAATLKGLTRMSLNTTMLAAWLAQKYPNAAVYFCVFKNNPVGATEADWKVELLRTGQVHEAGTATSTTDEEVALVEAAGSDIDESIVVGNGLHIRRAAMVWEHKHPDKKLYFKCTHPLCDDDINNPMKGQRHWQTWEVINLAGMLAFKVFGIEHYAQKNFSQPVG